jgi:hypothetical protein
MRPPDRDDSLPVRRKGEQMTRREAAVELLAVLGECSEGDCGVDEHPGERGERTLEHIDAFAREREIAALEELK